MPDLASRLRIVTAQHLDAASHSTTSDRIQRRCREDNLQWCGPGDSIPRSRFAAQSCSVETGTPVIRDTSPAVSTSSLIVMVDAILARLPKSVARQLVRLTQARFRSWSSR
jgi:hypothetical protein